MKFLISFITLLVLTSSCGQQNKEIHNQPSESISDSGIKGISLIGTGRITTIVDGFDVRRVNLWNSTNKQRAIICYLKDGDRVRILKEKDPYYLVESIEKNDCFGYCMKGFIVKD